MNTCHTLVQHAQVHSILLFLQVLPGVDGQLFFDYNFVKTFKQVQGMYACVCPLLG